MSAWIVQKEHIDLMLSVAMRYSEGRFAWTGGTLDSGNANGVGQMLVNANYASVNHRYSEFEMPPTYEWERVEPKVNAPVPISVLKAIACYEYQSCEHPAWHSSDARAFCKELTSFLVTQLPGYRDAPWGFDRTNVIKL